MTGRNKRASLRVRLAVAAAVLVGGGAAGVVGIAATHSNAATAATSAGYSTHMGRTMGYSDAMSSAMNGWSKSPSNSLMTLTHMKPMTNTMTMAWHKHVLAFQRGTVVAESIRQKELVVQSNNGKIETWHWNNGTKAVNVGGSAMGMSAMNGGTMSMPSRWNHHLNTKAKAAVKGDMVFVFGEKIKGKLIAQLVLFVTPMKVTPMPTPSMTVTPTVAPSMTTTPTAPATNPATGNTQPTHF
ncbi:MAG TPA: hypothetical protein VN714_13835 [Trebonia sp.]|jgi:hypothetical protein|nr:hypothetical protein [Trebonia sp.]